LQSALSVTGLNLRRIDLNLLTVFEAVYQERSQQKASERLFMSQPAISSAISRLRSQVDDRLFTGTRELKTTPRADEIYPDIHRALNLVRSQMASTEAFDPLNTHRTFSLAITYGGGLFLAQALRDRFEQEAPHARLQIRIVDPVDEIPRLMREQEVDLAISHLRFQEPMLESADYLDYELVLVARKDHPILAGGDLLDRLDKSRCIWVHDAEVQTHNPELQDYVRMVQERSKLEVPTLMLMVSAVESSNLIGISTRVHMEFLKQYFAIDYVPIPVVQNNPPSLLLWHRAFAEEAPQAWFRGLCMDFAKGVRHGERALIPER